MITINVNNKKIEANSGETILQVLNREGISVPTLCHMKNLMPSGACRICLVEAENFNGQLIPSCSYPVHDGLIIKTHSQKVVEARKMIIEMLLSNHPDDCLYCVRNYNCELQKLSLELNVHERRIRGKKNVQNKDKSSVSIERDPEKCILCGRCVRMCEEVIGVSAIDFIGRGNKTFIGTTFNSGLNTSSCVNCGQCIMVCPTGALNERSNLDAVIETLNNKDKIVVAQYAPSISVSLAEEFGIEAGKEVNGIMNSALRKLGFNKVFDTSFSADMTIMEESAELIQRILNKGTLPMFTSCCPGWVKYAEQFYPEMIPNLSSCKSPQQMLGSVIKGYYAETEGIDREKLVVVSIMPCTAKKFEASREEMIHKGINDVDYVITTRELGKLIKLYGIDINKLEPELADSPLGSRSTAGKIFGASGGVMEAAIRTAYFNITGKEMVQYKINEVRGTKDIKEAKIKIGEIELGIAVVNGLGNAGKLISEIKSGRKDLHFIEVMTCPNGCINGGGQHIGSDEKSVLARLKTLYDIDNNETIKVSHKNPEITEIYKNYLGKPLSKKSHQYVHTSYIKREIIL